MAIPLPLLLLPIIALALGGRKRGGGAAPAIGPWTDRWDPPRPIAEGKANNPEIDALLREMDDYFASYGINLDWINASEVTLLRKWGRHAIPPREYWPRMAATIRWGFQPIRAALGGPITITSAYRPPDYNEAVGGAEDSRHQYFEGLDMVASGGQANKQALLAAGIWIRSGERMRMGLGVYGSPGSASNIHIDTGRSQRTWNVADYWIDRVKAQA